MSATYIMRSRAHCAKMVSFHITREIASSHKTRNMVSPQIFTCPKRHFAFNHLVSANPHKHTKPPQNKVSTPHQRNHQSHNNHTHNLKETMSRPLGNHTRARANDCISSTSKMYITSLPDCAAVKDTGEKNASPTTTTPPAQHHHNTHPTRLRKSFLSNHSENVLHSPLNMQRLRADYESALRALRARGDT